MSKKIIEVNGFLKKCKNIVTMVDKVKSKLHQFEFSSIISPVSLNKEKEIKITNVRKFFIGVIVSKFTKFYKVFQKIEQKCFYSASKSSLCNLVPFRFLKI